MTNHSKLFPDNGFTFKQFFVAHDRCAMKVNTDAVILGAWSNISGAKRILDIGTGSGVIALMLAQRTETAQTVAQIDGVELDHAAYLQANDNFINSRWRERMTAIHQDIVDYAATTENRYDMIITNPPYFDQGSDCRSNTRNQARYTTTLTHQQLLVACKQLLTNQGRLFLALPYTVMSSSTMNRSVNNVVDINNDVTNDIATNSVAGKFVQLAQQMGWYLGRTLMVRDNELKSPYLLLLEMAPYCLCTEQLSSVSLSADNRFLTLRQLNRQYTDEYRQLTEPFYLWVNR